VTSPRAPALPGQTIRTDAIDKQTNIRLVALKADAGVSLPRDHGLSRGEAAGRAGGAD